MRHNSKRLKKSHADGERSKLPGIVKFLLPFPLVGAFYLGYWVWQGSGEDSAGQAGGVQVEESGGGWFSIDCDRERRRRRGGWLRGLVC